MRILVVEDEKKIATFIKKGLEETGYIVDVASSGGAAETLVSESEYDLVVLDVMLPDQNGFDTARNLRRDGFAAPIIILTALSSTKDRVQGLDAGADDYLVKPFELDELKARIRAQLRRASGQQKMSAILKCEDLELNLLERKVTRSQKNISLTQKEFALLEYLLRNVNRPVSRMQISEHVWDIHYDSESNFIDVCVNTLRKKIDQDFPIKLIRTVIGIGYKIGSDIK